MPTVSPTPITPPDEHLVTAREALEPLYERLELHTEVTLLSAAMGAGWPVDEATKAPVSYTHLTLPTNREV